MSNEPIKTPSNCIIITDGRHRYSVNADAQGEILISMKNTPENRASIVSMILRYAEDYARFETQEEG